MFDSLILNQTHALKLASCSFPRRDTSARTTGHRIQERYIPFTTVYYFSSDAMSWDSKNPPFNLQNENHGTKKEEQKPHAYESESNNVSKQDLEPK